MSTDIQIDEQKEAVRLYFSDETPWKTIYSEDGWNPFMARQRLRYVIRLMDQLQIRSKGAALDLGCGCGEYSRLLLDRGFKVTACDSSEDMVIEARKNAGYANGSFQAIVADAESLPFAAESFQLILCIGVLAYLRKDNEAIGEMFRVLAPGGHLILTVLNSVRLGRLPKLCAGKLLRGLKLIPPRTPTGASIQVQEYEMVRRSHIPRQLDATLRLSGFEKLTSLSLGYSPSLLIRKRPKTAQKLSATVDKAFQKLHLPFQDRFGRYYIVAVRRSASEQQACSPGQEQQATQGARGQG